MEELYNIVFKGELVRSFDVDTAKKNVGKLFKIDGPKLEALFSGKSVVLKRNLAFDAANKYRVAIKKAGARVDLVPVAKPADAPVENTTSPAAPEPAPTSTPPRSQGKAVFGERTSAFASPSSSPSSQDDTASPENPKALPEVSTAQASTVPATKTVSSQEGGISLAPVGASVLADSEREVAPVSNIDVSALSVKEGGGDLLEAGEKRQYEAVDVNLEGIDLAPTGSDLLKENEKISHVAKEVDLSVFELAEPGARLGEPKPAAPPAPDVSGISLEN